MSIIQFHAPKGIVEIDSDKVTDTELAKIKLSRQRFNHVLSQQPRDLAAEIDELKARLERVRTGRLAEIVATSPQAITMPEIWEAIRILAKC